MPESRRGYATALVIAAVGFLAPAPAAHAYVDLAPTLNRLVRESRTITLAEVDRCRPDKGMIVLKKVRDLKGETGSGSLKHYLLRSNEPGLDRALLTWVEPGARCVLFTAGNTVLVCLGEAWYQASTSDDGWWRLAMIRTELPLAYFGTVSRLGEAVSRLVAGRSAVITVLPHGAGGEGASFDLALNRASLPGLVKVQRVRVSMTMPEVAMAVGSNEAFVLGAGWASREEVPALRQQLRAAGAAARAEAAAVLGWLGADAADAATDLSRLLDDAAPRPRLAAASALLRIEPKARRPLTVLTEGQASADAATRRHAARAAGLAGAAAAPLAGKLAALLQDPDVAVRRSALQALATLGPAAADAVAAVTELLKQPESAVDAADALGRMGSAARPALKPLAKMLAAESVPQRWAAVRAMAQIGGPDAEPAVRFMIRELPTAPHVESYNMLIYLSLLGPVARDAIPAVRQARVMNGMLRETTAWAIDPGAEMPALGPAGNIFFVQLILESYVQEFGDRLKPVAKSLARRILAGTAGDVPGWGYKLLARWPEQSLAILVPALGDERLVMRERVTVALGYMGRPARAAGPHVAQALKAAQDEREQLLLKWCLRQMGGAAVPAAAQASRSRTTSP
jgi:HEAT repeat protein